MGRLSYNRRISVLTSLSAVILCFLFLFVKNSNAQWKEITDLPFGFRNNLWLDVMFLPSNPDFGWICGMEGKVLRTTDRGRTWRGSTVSNVGFSGHLEHIQFLTPLVGYCSGPDNSRIFKSTDGGASWFDVTPIGIDPFASVWGCYFVSADEGILLATIGCDTQLFYKTNDGGATWTLFFRNDPNVKISDAILYPDGSGFVVGSGVIYRTIDRGATWQPFTFTGNVTWHEEISRFGQSLLVPSAGNTCAGAMNVGGMRFSPDNGSTWRNFTSGVPSMFGAFLMNAQVGWACGRDRAVYQTTDAGLTWQLKNCGIRQGHDLDDLWFIAPEEGWVVGNGIYRYAGDEPPAMYPDNIAFGNTCIGDTAKRLISLTNLFSRTETVELRIPQNLRSLFSFTGGLQRVDIPCKDSVLVELRFHPNGQVQPTGVIECFFREANQTFTIDISGFGTGGFAGIQQAEFTLPELIITSSATIVTVPWKPTSAFPSYNIVAIQPVTASQAIVPVAQQLPVNVANGREVPIRFTLNPPDTGWHQADFRVRLSDCLTDTVIRLRFYAVSPIITVPDRPLLILRDCAMNGIDSVPVKNSGNDTLKIFGARLSVNQDNSFTLLGWSGANTTYPITIAPGDSVFLRYEFEYELPGTAQAEIDLTHNDARPGIPNPYPLALRARRNFPILTVNVTELDFGVLCVGESQIRRVTLGNDGNAPVLLQGYNGGGGQFAVVRLPGNSIIPRATAEAQIAFAPTSAGVFDEVIELNGSPCQQKIAVRVKGIAVSSRITAQPTTLDMGTLPIAAEKTDTIRVIHVGTERTIISAVSFVPPLPPEAQVSLPQLVGRTIMPGDTLLVPVTFASVVATEYNGEIVFSHQAVCPGEIRLPFTVQSIPSSLRLSEQELRRNLRCTDTPLFMPLTISNEGVLPIEITSVALQQSVTMFALNLPVQLPLVLNGGEEFTFQVAVNNPQVGTFNAEVVLTSTEITQPQRRIPVTLQVVQPQTISLTSSVSFLASEVCRQREEITFRLQNIGTATDTVTLSTLAGFPFTVNEVGTLILTPGADTLITVVCSPASLGEGQFLGTIQVESRICGSPISIPTSIVIQPSAIQLVPEQINFGVLARGERRTERLTIRNRSIFPRSFTLQPSLQQRNIILPDELLEQITLAPSEERTYTIIAEGRDIGLVDLSVVIEDNYCTQKPISLLAAAVADEPYKLRFSYRNYTAQQGEVLQIPLLLNGALTALNPRSVVVETVFERTMLQPLQITDKQGNAIPYSYDNSGMLRISLTPEIVAPFLYVLGNDDTLFILQAKAFLAPVLTSPLNIRTVQIDTDEATTIETVNGLVQMPEICPVERLPLRFIPTTKVKKITTSAQHIEIAATVTEQQRVFVVVKDFFGRECGRGEFHVSKGEHTFIVPCAYLATGVYFVEITDPAKSIVNKVLIEK